MELKNIKFSNCEARLLKSKKGELFYLYDTKSQETTKIKFTTFATLIVNNIEQKAMRCIDEKGMIYFFSTKTKRFLILLNKSELCECFIEDETIMIINNKRDIETINKKFKILEIIQNEIFSDNITLSTIEPIAQMMVELNKI